MNIFLLDRITSLNLGKSASALKCITYSDEILRNHFTENPILPGIFIIEGLSQLSGFLVTTTINQDPKIFKDALLLNVTKFNFHQPSVPGDCLEYHSVLNSICGDIAEFNVQAVCNGEVRCKGTIKQMLIDRYEKQSDPQWLEAYKAWTLNLPDCPPLR